MVWIKLCYALDLYDITSKVIYRSNISPLPLSLLISYLSVFVKLCLLIVLTKHLFSLFFCLFILPLFFLPFFTPSHHSICGITLLYFWCWVVTTLGCQGEKHCPPPIPAYSVPLTKSMLPLC